MTIGIRKKRRQKQKQKQTNKKLKTKEKIFSRIKDIRLIRQQRPHREKCMRDRTPTKSREQLKTLNTDMYMYCIILCLKDFKDEIRVHYVVQSQNETLGTLIICHETNLYVKIHKGTKGARKKNWRDNHDTPQWPELQRQSKTHEIGISRSC